MPSFPECLQCEFRNNPDVNCYAMRNGGHRRFCQLAHELGRQDAKNMLHVKSLEHLATPMESRPAVRSTRSIAGDLLEHQYITVGQLEEHATGLVGMIPPDVQAICPASPHAAIPVAVLSGKLGIPVADLSGTPKATVLIVADSVLSGLEFEQAEDDIKQAWPQVTTIRAAVYVHPSAYPTVDLCYAKLPGRHLLAWKWMDSPEVLGMAFELDGVLRNGDAPLYRPTRSIPVIITGRHKDEEADIRSWLDGHGYKYDRIRMRCFDLEGDADEQIATYKADEFRSSQCSIFVESNVKQAETINRLTGKMVLCPDVAVYPPTTPNVSRMMADLQAIKTCTVRTTEGCGCGGKAKCGLGKGQDGLVHIQDCLACHAEGKSKVPGGHDGATE